MTDKDYFEGFDETKYEEEAKERWGQSAAYAQSQRNWGSYSKEQKDAIKAEGADLMVRMVGTDPNGLGSTICRMAFWSASGGQDDVDADAT